MIDNEKLRKALSLWNLNNKYELIAFRENVTYKTFNYDGLQLVLRFHRKNYSSREEINSELIWLNALNEEKINVPKPVKSVNRKFIEKVNDQYVSALTWLRGSPLTKLNSDEKFLLNNKIFFNLGKELAKIHLFSDRWNKKQTLKRRKWNVEGLLGDYPLWDKFWCNPKLTGDQKKRIILMRNKCHEILENNLTNLDYGLIHADAVRDNVLYNKNMVSLIDFDDSGYGFRLFDLATTLLYYLEDKNFLIIKNQLIKGYLSIKSLNLELLDIFILIRSFTYVGWNIKRMNEPFGKQRNKKYINNVFFTNSNLKILF